MPKIRKNGTKPKPKAKGKGKSKVKDNTDTRATKSKSINQSQNVNVNVTIAKHKTGTSRKGGEQPNIKKTVEPEFKPQPPNIYYQQQPASNNSSNSNNAELTTLLKDMKKELYSQRNIVATQNQPLLNPRKEQINKPLISNAFEDEPFESHFDNISEMTPSEWNTEDNSTINSEEWTTMKVVDDSFSDTLPKKTYKDPPLAKAYPLTTVEPLISVQPPPPPLNEQFVEEKRLFDTFGEPLTKEEIPEPKTIKKKKTENTREFTAPKVPNRVESTSDFTEQVAVLKEPPIGKDRIISRFQSKRELQGSSKEKRIEEIKRIEEVYGVDLGYQPNMRASEVYGLLDPYVRDGRTKK